MAERRESRDVDDARDLLRAMRKESRAEFDAREASDTGGQERASREDREGQPAARRESQDPGSDRSSREQGSAGSQRVPSGGAATGGGGNATRGPTPPGPGEPHED